jgi:hypothetical protein
VRTFYERTRRDDSQRQKVTPAATARHLVRVMWALLRQGTTWPKGVAKAA